MNYCEISGSGYPKFKRVVGNIKTVSRSKNTGYNVKVVWPTVHMVVNLIMVDKCAFRLNSCTPDKLVRYFTLG